MDKHISLARELGYEGQELRDYLKRQQDLEREERLAQREYEKEKREAEQKDKEREQKDKEWEQKDKEREQKEKDREQKDKDRELEKLKIEAAHKDKEMEMEKEIALKKIEAEVELKKIEAETTSHPWGPKEKSSNPRSPKLPYFDEHTDKMDSYLTRFESYALSNKWDPSMWASYLSALLKGRALEVFVRLSRDDQSDYGQIKEALLTNFDLTERSFRKKFRDCRPEKAETFRQFSGRLASYLDKWLGLAKVEKTYEAVCDFLARDQFLDCCSHELYLYLKPKPFKAIDELAHEADLFADAKGGVPLCITKGKQDSKRVDQAQPKVEPKQDQRPVIQCKICGKPHPTFKCWNNPDNKRVASSAEFDSQYKGGNSNWGQDRSFGRVDQRNNHFDNSHNDNNNRTDHQVNFCKIDCKSLDVGKGQFSSPHSSLEGLPRKDSKGTCHFPRSRLPTAVGTINGKEIRVLRDTGCTGVVVRRSLVSDGQMLNKQSGVTLINNYKQRCPVARINIDCPFFRGTTDALCIDDPAHDLVIGNVEGSKFPDITHFSSGVVRNKRSKKSRKDRKVKVADKFIRQHRQELCMMQASDAKLADIRRREESGSVTKSRSFSSGETKFIRRNGLIYRHFKKNAKVSLQLVVPSSLTHSVMNLAHESRKVVNHRGRKETISKVLDEFYWPGVCREVTQFCRSCAICQRTTHNIKVAMTHCCSVPQRNISSKEAVVSRTIRTDSQTERRRSYGSGRRCPIPYYWRNMTVTDSSSQH